MSLSEKPNYETVAESVRKLMACEFEHMGCRVFLISLNFTLDGSKKHDGKML
jgi:hypothetical protein